MRKRTCDCNSLTLLRIASEVPPLLVQVQCACLLKWHADWAAASGGLTQTSATWLYALTARLQRPLPQVRIQCHAVPSARLMQVNCREHACT